MDVFQARLSKALRDIVEDRIRIETARLISTPAVDFADYKRRLGFVSGLQMALEELGRLELKLDRAEDSTEPAPQQSHRRYED